MTRRDTQPFSGTPSPTTASGSEKNPTTVKTSSASAASTNQNATSADAADLQSTSATSSLPGKDKSKDSTDPTSSAPAVKSNENAVEARLIVGPEVKLKGAEILDCDTLVVEGRVEATMDSRVLRIAENGSFAGKVSIDIAEIHGIFEGELTARSQLIIHSTGRVSGTVHFGKLVVDEGGELCGEINVLTDKTHAASSSASSSRASSETSSSASSS
ncbi:MAG: polymer-forming cytoskeletal protein [Propionivibrio sp.]